MDEELIQDFIDDVKELIAEFEETLLNLDKDRDNLDYVSVMFRAMHSLKGASAMFGFEILGNFTHKLEGLYDKIRDGVLLINDEIIKISFTAIDHIKQLLTDPKLLNQELKNKHQQISAEIDKIFNSNTDNSKEEEQGKDGLDLIITFKDETIELSSALEKMLLDVDVKNISENELNEILRIMHTIKGNSKMFGYDSIAKLTHELENIWDVKNKNLKNDRLKEITLKSIDYINNAISSDNSDSQENLDVLKILLDEITKMLSEDSKSVIIKKNIKSKTYYIYIKPNYQVLDDNFSLKQIVDNLSSKGNCLFILRNDKSPIEFEYSEDKKYDSIEIIIEFDKGLNKIIELFTDIEKKCELEVRLIAETNLFKFKKFNDLISNIARNNSKINLEQLTPIIDEVIRINLTEDLNKAENTSTVKLRSRGKLKKHSSIRVSSEKINEMMNLVSELVTTQAELTLLTKNKDDIKLLSVAESIANLSRRFRDNAFNISLVPLEITLTKFERMVRDMSKKMNKDVDFVIEGADTELDKTIIEHLTDPILHILRNSLDHGIENYDERQKKNKPTKGKILLKSYYSGAYVYIEISDDGNGIDTHKVRQKAIDKGFISSEDELTKQQLLNLTFLPGFSTTDSVSEVSGRGVGMDVVKRKISEVRGKVNIDSEPNVGTTITIKIPLTLSIVDSLLVKIDKSIFAIPLSSIVKIHPKKHSEISNAFNNLIEINDRQVAFVNMRNELNLPEYKGDVEQLLTVKYDDAEVGVVVDEVIGEYQAVLKPLGKLYHYQEIFSGATILGDGTVALVMDTSKVINLLSNKVKQDISN